MYYECIEDAHAGVERVVARQDDPTTDLPGDVLLPLQDSSQPGFYFCKITFIRHNSSSSGILNESERIRLLLPWIPGPLQDQVQ